MNTRVLTIDNREVMMMNIVFLSLLIIAVMIKILGEMI